MTTPAIYPSALLACFALSVIATPSASQAVERTPTPIERTPAEGPAIGRLVSDDAPRHVVAKPAYPVWEDATRLVNDQRAVSPTAQRRTVFQNPPDPLNLRGLSDGFREGTRPLTKAGQQAGEWIDSQARGLAEGTRQAFDQTGESLRRGTQNTLDGTANALQRALPGSTSPYAERTQYDANGYDYNQQPTPAQVDDNQYANPNANYSDARLRDAQLRADQQRLDQQQRARRQQEADSLAADQRAYQLRLDRDRAARERGGTSNGLAEQFAEPRSQLAPVRRTERSTASTERDAWRPFDDNSTANNYPPRSSRDEASDSTGFPALNPPRTDWDESLARGQSPNPAPPYGQQPYGPPYNPTAGLPPTQGNTNTPPNTDATGWGGQAGGQQPAGTNPGGFVGANVAGDIAGRDEDPTNLDRLLLVILGAASCFTWLAYYDVRQKYRLALRGVQVSDFGTQSVAA